MDAMQNRESPLLIACLDAEANQDQEAIVREAARRLDNRMRVGLCQRAEQLWFAKQFKVVGTPTFLLFSNGGEQGRMLGKTDLDSLLGFVGSMLVKDSQGRA